MLVVEPVLGEGGYLPQPTSYIQGLQALCKKHGIMFVLDEVQTGFGRTGTFFTSTQIGVVPDFLLFAKGIANGLPLAGVATTKVISASQPAGTQGGTYSGNALACASAAEVIRIMRDEGVLQNAVERGNQLRTGLERILMKHPTLPVQELRGRGLMLALQFTDEAPAGIAQEFVNQSFARGMLVLNTSKFEVIRFIPPLTVSREEVDEGLRITEEALLAAVEAKKCLDDGKRIKRLLPCCATPCNKLDGSSFVCRSMCDRQ
jgi:4-aminobutyrate aminotransferase